MARWPVKRCGGPGACGGVGSGCPGLCPAGEGQR